MKLLTYTQSTRSHHSNPNIGFFYTINLILTACVLFFSPPRTAAAQTIHIPDPNLRAALELALDKEVGADLTQVDMASLESLQNGCRFLRLSKKGVWWVPERWTCESTDLGVKCEF